MIRTATVVICFKKKLLFFQRDYIPNIPNPDKWQFPGGHVEKNESPDEAIRRELREEVSFVPTQLVHIWEIKTKDQETHIYWSYVTNKEAKRFKLGTNEGQLIKFMSIERALSLNLTDNVRYYLILFQKLLLKHMKDKTVPTASEFSI